MERAIIPFNTPLSPGSPANETGVQKVENLLPTWGGYRSVPRPSGGLIEASINDGALPEDDAIGISLELAGGMVAVGVQEEQTVVSLNDNDLPSDASTDTLVSYEGVIPVIGVRNNIFVGSQQINSYSPVDETLGDITRVTGTSRNFGRGPTGTPWDFAQMGDIVIATNYVDPVVSIRIRDSLDDASYQAEAMIDTLSRPRAKYVTVVGNHVLLSNLRFSDDTNQEYDPDLKYYAKNPAINTFTAFDPGGTAKVKENWPNAIWWSAQGDPGFFSSLVNVNATGSVTEANLAIESLSDFEIIQDVPGAIRGSVGFPEAAIIFTEYGSSVLRLTGGPEVFDRRVLELGIGCVSAKSIVAVDQDVYFLAQDGFRVINSFGRSASIVPPDLGRIFSEERFGSKYAIANKEITYSLWDPIIRVIFWFYKNLQGATVAACYNIDDQRWTFLKDPLLDDYFLGVSVPSRDGMLAGIYLAKQRSANANYIDIRQWRTSGSLIHTLTGALRTKSFSLAPDQGQIGAISAHIARMRPVFRKLSDSDNPEVDPAVSLTVYSSVDPSFRKETRTYTDFTQASALATQDGWYRPRGGAIKGCTFEVELEFEEAHDQAVWDVLGVQVEYKLGGEI